jgi:hypothetical protein
MLDLLLAVLAFPGSKALVIGTVYGGVQARTFNPVKALKKIGWKDYFAGYLSGFIAGYLIFGLDH